MTAVAPVLEGGNSCSCSRGRETLTNVELYFFCCGCLPFLLCSPKSQSYQTVLFCSFVLAWLSHFLPMLGRLYAPSFKSDCQYFMCALLLVTLNLYSRKYCISQTNKRYAVYTRLDLCHKSKHRQQQLVAGP